MARAPRRFLLLALAAAPFLAGCGPALTYRPDPVVTRGQFTVIENFSSDPISPEQVDALLAEVAHLLDVRLDPARPKARLLVTTPSRIADLYRATTTVAASGADAEALYFPGAALVLVPYWDRTLVAHELAHYLTDLYLRSRTTRADWERIAHAVERRLPASPAPVTPATTVAAVSPAATIE